MKYEHSKGNIYSNKNNHQDCIRLLFVFFVLLTCRSLLSCRFSIFMFVRITAFYNSWHVCIGCIFFIMKIVAKTKYYWRRFYNYWCYDFKEIAFPSSLPDPPGTKQSRKLSWKDHVFVSFSFLVLLLNNMLRQSKHA